MDRQTAAAGGVRSAPPVEQDLNAPRGANGLDRSASSGPARTDPSIGELSLARACALLSAYDVRSMLVASDGRTWREHLLAVTSEGLGILTPSARREPREDEWVLQVARWSLVRLGQLNETPAEDDGSRFDLVVRVGRRVFVVLLDGPGGQRALRDFVVAVQKGVRGDFASRAYPATSMLTTWTGARRVRPQAPTPTEADEAVGVAAAGVAPVPSKAASSSTA